MAEYKVPELAYEFPSEDITAESGYRVLSVDLNNGRFMWDLEVFRQLERATSWYQELGAFPTHALIFVDTTRGIVEIYDRKDNTTWATFTAGANNFLLNSTAINDIDFVDGVLAVADDTNGLQLVDFVRDAGYRYDTNGLYVKVGDIADRDGALGELLVNTIIQLNHDDVTSVSMARDHDDQYVEMDIGRTVPDILVTTDDEVTLLKARDHASNEQAAYDLGTASIVGLYCVITPDGHCFSAYSDVTNDKVRWDKTAGIIADTWPAANDTIHGGGTTGGGINPVSSGAVISMIDAIPGVSAADGASPVLAIGTDEGLTLKHLDDTNESDGITFFFDNVAAHPPLAGKATLKDSWWLGSVAGLQGKTLTNGGTVTFAAAVTGNGAVFTEGGATVLSRTGDADLDTGTDDFAIGFYFKSTNAANPGSSVNLLNLEDAGGQDMLEIFANTSGQIVARITDDSGATWDTITTTADYYNALWHSLMLVRDNNTLYLYIDGKQAGTVAVALAATALDFAEIYVGNDKAAGTGFGGTMDDLFFWQLTDATNAARHFSRFWHRRMQSGLNNASIGTELDLAPVTWVSSDHEGEHFMFGDANDMYVIDRFGIIIQNTATPGGTIQDGDIWTLPGAAGFAYALGTTTTVNVQQVNVDLADILL